MQQNYANIKEEKYSTKLETLRALIPIDISLLDDDLKFFTREDYQMKKIRVDKLSDENNELEGDTTKTCERCYGEIFNVYLKKKTNEEGHGVHLS